MARRVGQEEAAQAVGTACGENPIPLIIPCHRVVTAGAEYFAITDYSEEEA